MWTRLLFSIHPRRQKADPRIKKAGQPASAKKKTDASKSYDGLRKVLLIAGIVLLIAGGWRLMEAIDEWLLWEEMNSYVLEEMIPAILMSAGGVFSLIFQGVLKKRSARFKVYEAACLGRDYISLDELSSKTGVSPKKVRRDIESMLDKGMLTNTAYIDHGDGLLILDPSAKPQKEPPPEPEHDDGEDRYKAILRQIRELMTPSQTRWSLTG